MFTNTSTRIFIVLFVLVLAMVTVSFTAHSANVPIANHSYDAIEQTRANRSNAALVSGYSQIESLRLQRNAPSLASNSSYDLIEQVRSERGFIVNRSYDKIEALRLQR